eukprot:3328808-Ditylum_brightwellii.AAC.1
MYKYLHAKEEETKVQRYLDKISKGVTVPLDNYEAQYAAADQEKREGVLKEVERLQECAAACEAISAHD